MKRFWWGFTVLGVLYLLMAILALVNESLQQMVGPLLRLMSKPLRPIYDAFHLVDDDARVIYPIILSAVLWGAVGGAANVLTARFARREKEL